MGSGYGVAATATTDLAALLRPRSACHRSRACERFFLVGDDYGRPTNLPWGIAFPNGLPPTSVPVHPTQLYEAAGLAIIAWALIRWRRSGLADRVVFGRYLVLAGALRFAIEFIRINAYVMGPFTLAQLFSAGIIIAGVTLAAAKKRASART